MPDVSHLLDRPTYGLRQVDRLLALPPGTARRWIDGYRRGARSYPPVVRVESTGDEIVTWGEFVETRLLSEYRNAGVPLVRMRPAIDRLRDRLQVRYPLAHARPFVADRELVLAVQDEVGLETALRLVVVRNDQLMLSHSAGSFYDSVDFEGADGGHAVRLRPVASIPEVAMDPRRQFGEPTVRSVRTELLAEQYRAGDSIDAIAEVYELSRETVEAALRYEFVAAGTSRSAG